MKHLIYVIFVLFICSINAQDLTLLHINAKWNQSNNYDLKGLKNCKVRMTLIEDLNPSMRAQIKSLPTIILLDKNGKPTLLTPINKIRPNIYQTIYPSYGNFYDSYYYNGWRYNTNVYSNHKTYESNSSQGSNNSNNSFQSESKDISRLEVNESKVKMKN